MKCGPYRYPQFFFQDCLMLHSLHSNDNTFCGQFCMYSHAGILVKIGPIFIL